MENGVGAGTGRAVFPTFEELAARGPYDVCISTSVVEHLDQPLDAMRQMAAILRPGGLAYVTGIVGSVASPEQWSDLVKRVRRGEPIPKNVNPWEHLNYFTEATLDAMMRKAGFRGLPDCPGIWRVPDAIPHA